MSQYKVVFHIDEMAKWSLVLSNAKNILADLGENVEVVVLANAEAVKGYLESSEFDGPIQELMDEKVRFVACRNALKANEISVDQLMEKMNVVPAGVSELVKLQSQGYAYVRP